MPPPPVGRRHPLTTPHTPRRLRRLDPARAFGDRPPPNPHTSPPKLAVSRIDAEQLDKGVGK